MREIAVTDASSRLPEKYRRRAREIVGRVAEIDTLIAPCKPEDIRDAMVRMVGQFRDQPETEHSDMAAEFLAACRDLPAWGISEAAGDFLGGRVDNHTGQFMPTCAEFAKRVRSIILPFLSERSCLRAEASKLVERAEDERHRHLIEMERQNPSVRSRVAALAAAATAGAPKSQARPHGGLSIERREALDALRKPRAPFASRIAQTRIGKL